MVDCERLCNVFIISFTMTANLRNYSRSQSFGNKCYHSSPLPCTFQFMVIQEQLNIVVCYRAPGWAFYLQHWFKALAQISSTFLMEFETRFLWCIKVFDSIAVYWLGVSLVIVKKKERNDDIQFLRSSRRLWWRPQTMRHERDFIIRDLKKTTTPVEIHKSRIDNAKMAAVLTMLCYYLERYSNYDLYTNCTFKFCMLCYDVKYDVQSKV